MEWIKEVSKFNFEGQIRDRQNKNQSEKIIYKGPSYRKQVILWGWSPERSCKPGGGGVQGSPPAQKLGLYSVDNENLLKGFMW